MEERVWRVVRVVERQPKEEAMVLYSGGGGGGAEGGEYLHILHIILRVRNVCEG